MLASIIVLSILIFFHELGHFLAARFFGVQVNVFSIGFGTKIFKKTYKGTQYAISLIPLGGYVQMKGQDDLNPALRSTDKDSYNAKKPWQRIIILFAGPFFNFIIAFFLFAIAGMIGVNELSNNIGEVTANTPAQKAGILKNDKIISINGMQTPNWEALSNTIKNSTGTLHLEIVRENKIIPIALTPIYKEVENIFKEKIKRKVIGIVAHSKLAVAKYSFVESFSYAYHESIKATKLIITSLEKMIQGIISPKEMGGIISIVKITGDASEAGIIPLLILTALLSVNLGILNLLPIPALDGGHIMFNLYEMITRRIPSEKIIINLTITGWVILLSLMVFTIYNDIDRFFLSK
jgi:regulator of sigma E protease